MFKLPDEMPSSEQQAALRMLEGLEGDTNPTITEMTDDLSKYLHDLETTVLEFRKKLNKIHEEGYPSVNRYYNLVERVVRGVVAIEGDDEYPLFADTEEDTERLIDDIHDSLLSQRVRDRLEQAFQTIDELDTLGYLDHNGSGMTLHNRHQ